MLAVSPDWHIVLAGGGTGGHLFPGLAVAERLLQRVPEARFTFIGTGKPSEEVAVVGRGFRYASLPTAPTPQTIWRLPSFAYRNAVGYRAAAQFLRREGVNLVVALGGYGAAAVGLAAARATVPLVVLEQNVVPGRANWWLGRWAVAVCGAFSESRDKFSRPAQFRWTGNPVRREIAEVPRRRGKTGVATLAVLGGSQGARSVNRAMVELLPKLAEFAGRWEIVHQTGTADWYGVWKAYQQTPIRATVRPFLDKIGAVYRAADLVVSRAGGTTLAELACVGVPAVLVPYPYAAKDHQMQNARVYERRGGARVVGESIGGIGLAERIGEVLGPLMGDCEARQKMSAAMVGMGRPDAADRVCDAILGVLSDVGRPSGRLMRWRTDRSSQLPRHHAIARSVEAGRRAR